jgi:hypothetical protein
MHTKQGKKEELTESTPCPKCFGKLSHREHPAGWQHPPDAKYWVGFSMQPGRLALLYENNPAFTVYSLTTNRARTFQRLLGEGSQWNGLRSIYVEHS